MKSLVALAALLMLGASDPTFIPFGPQEMPQLKKKVEPAYPEVLKRAGIEGEVMVKATISENGKVDKAEAVKASKPEFAEASLAAIKQWEFTPAQKDGKAVKAEVFVPFRFKLGDKVSRAESAEVKKLADQVANIIKGEVPDDLKELMEPGAYGVVGNKYESLYALFFDKPKENQLVGSGQLSPSFSHVSTSVSEDAAVLVLKSSAGKGKRDRYDSVVLMKSAEGVWKIHSWHMSM